MRGKLTVITGPMGSGKTYTLISLLSRHQVRGKSVQVYKWSEDNRILDPDKDDGKPKIESRIGLSISALPVKDSVELMREIAKGVPDVVAVEEAHFFDEKLPEAVTILLKMGLDVYLTGLNLDFAGRPFNQMPTLLALADDIQVLTAVCSVCGSDNATKTQKLLADGRTAPIDSSLIDVGAENYTARCNNCWVEPI